MQLPVLEEVRLGLSTTPLGGFASTTSRLPDAVCGGLTAVVDPAGYAFAVSVFFSSEVVAVVDAA